MPEASTRARAFAFAAFSRQRASRKYGTNCPERNRVFETNCSARFCDRRRSSSRGLKITTASADVARPGSTVGIVGVPHGQVPFAEAFFRNVGWRGGPAPARIYIPELLDDVLAGTIDPGQVLDYEKDLERTPDAYRAMDERRAIKSLIRVGSL